MVVVSRVVLSRWLMTRLSAPKVVTEDATMLDAAMINVASWAASAGCNPASGRHIVGLPCDVGLRRRGRQRHRALRRHLHDQRTVLAAIVYPLHVLEGAVIRRLSDFADHYQIAVALE